MRSSINIRLGVISLILLTSSCGESSDVQPNAIDRTKLDLAIEAYGKVEYDKARPLFEGIVASNTEESTIAFYYLGTCYEQIENLESAKQMYQKATQTPFNKAEAFFRLKAIASGKGEAERVEEYQKALTAISDQLRTRCPDLRSKKGLVPSRTGYPPYLRPGITFVWMGEYEEATRAFEYQLDQHVTMGNRFRTHIAAAFYEQLALAYHNHAKQLKEKKTDVKQIKQTELLTLHNELRLRIAEIWVGKDWKSRVYD